MYTSGHLRPDHSTLSRFRKDNFDLIAEYFVQPVRLAQNKGLSDFKIVSIDGSKIQASCSRKRSKTSDDLERYLAKVPDQIAEYMQSCDFSDLVQSQDDREPELESVTEKLTQLKNLEQKLLERQKQLDERKETIKKEHRENHSVRCAQGATR